MAAGPVIAAGGGGVVIGVGVGPPDSVSARGGAFPPERISHALRWPNVATLTRSSNSPNTYKLHSLRDSTVERFNDALQCLDRFSGGSEPASRAEMWQQRCSPTVVRAKPGAVRRVGPLQRLEEKP